MEERRAVIARAKANQNASDKGTAGSKAVESVRKSVSKKKLKNGAEGKTKGKTDTRNSATKELDAKIKRAGG